MKSGLIKKLLGVIGLLGGGANLNIAKGNAFTSPGLPPERFEAPKRSRSRQPTRGDILKQRQDQRETLKEASSLAAYTHKLKLIHLGKGKNGRTMSDALLRRHEEAAL